MSTPVHATQSYLRNCRSQLPTETHPSLNSMLPPNPSLRKISLRFSETVVDQFCRTLSISFVYVERVMLTPPFAFQIVL